MKLIFRFPVSKEQIVEIHISSPFYTVDEIEQTIKHLEECKRILLEKCDIPEKTIKFMGHQDKESGA